MGPFSLGEWVHPLLVLHALVALAALGSSTHLVVIVLKLRRHAPHLVRLARLHAQVLGAAYLTAVGAGLLLYPRYRYAVRGLLLDREAPWASNLFDFKEQLVALGVPLAVLLLVLGRRLTGEVDPVVRQLLLVTATLTWSAVLVASLTGLLVTSLRGLG